VIDDQKKRGGVDSNPVPASDNKATSKKDEASGMVAIVKDVVFIFGAYLIFSLFFFESFHIPSSSMEPTLEVGDRLLVSKPSYGFNKHSFFFDIGWEDKVWADEPKRGDVAVFSNKGNTDYIKRVIGVPGDRIQMRSGRLYINGRIIEREFIRRVRYTNYQGTPQIVNEYRETLPGGLSHLIYETSDTGPSDNTAEIVVQPGHFFMMGDNRDNSNDSRADVGQVPLKYFVGKAQVTTFSFFDCDQGKDVYCMGPVPLGRFFNAIN